MSKNCSAKTWFQTAAESCFGLILPSGWLGRPYDNQHVIDEFRVSDLEIYFRFDKLREIKVVKPGKIQVCKDDSGQSKLSITEFEKIEFTWVPYGEEGNQPQIKVFCQGEITLIGYYI